MRVNSSRGPTCLEVVEIEQGGRYETRGIIQMTRCSMLGFIRMQGGTTIFSFVPLFPLILLGYVHDSPGYV